MSNMQGLRNHPVIFWRFIHMLAHIPLGFGEPRWATRFHDWTGSKWESVPAVKLQEPTEGADK